MFYCLNVCVCCILFCHSKEETLNFIIAIGLLLIYNMQSHEFNILICLFIYVCQFLYFICVGVAKFSGM